MRPEDLYAWPNALASDYSHFRVAERLLLTGHSHQAWPDCGFAAQQQAWLDAAEHVDDKWPVAFAQSAQVRRGFGRLLGEPDGDIALDQNTFDLVVRFISALPLRTRPRLVATDGEFHTLHRLLGRLSEESLLEVVRIPAHPVEDLATRLAAAVTDRTAAVFCSSVLFQTGHIVPGLPAVARACALHGTELFVDAYHHLNVVPFSLQGLERAYVVGGGYKYCQLGEGACFLRLPKDCQLRPLATGWFSAFDDLENESREVRYGPGWLRFAGATFDPTSHYRAAAVFRFFEERGLTPTLLREVSQHQVKLLARLFDDLDLDPRVIRRDRTVPLEQVGGFLVLWCDSAEQVARGLEKLGVWTDHRGPALRLGPAPYLADAQLVTAMERLGQVIRQSKPDALAKASRAPSGNT